MFNHILGNSIAHGLETPQLRLERKKSERGEIRIFIEETKGKVKISFSDDGAGLNLVALEKKVGKAEGEDDISVAKSIFSAGLSTAESVTSLSGRGVGLGAVKSLIEDLGGEIDLFFSGPRTEEGFRPFKLTLNLDKKLSSLEDVTIKKVA